MAKPNTVSAAAEGESDQVTAEPKPHGDPRKILKLAMPVSLESIFQMGFNVIDQVIVGRLGAEAVASVGLSNGIASIALLRPGSVPA